jgi:hypothetical protein
VTQSDSPDSMTAPTPLAEQFKEHAIHVTEFAAALADRLPSRWLADTDNIAVATDPARPRIWDRGPLSVSDLLTGQGRRCVLTSPHGLQLYVTPRPGRPHRLVVAPMLPAATSPIHVRGLPPPRAVSVRDDPARAAATVRRRLLHDYRMKALSAWRQASTGPLRVEVRLDAGGRPAWNAPYLRALLHLLGEEDYLLDPVTGLCHLPDEVSREQAARMVRESGARLAEIGFHVPGAADVSANSTSTAPIPSGTTIRRMPRR